LKPFDLTMKDDQLLAKKGIFHQKVSSAASQICNRANSRRRRWLVSPNLLSFVESDKQVKPRTGRVQNPFVIRLKGEGEKSHDTSGEAKTTFFG
jgi:hypothetical protein